ncbi:hypothetical protein ACIBF5_09405 [Micromonospora sp. NPDC050417]|uniref:hypothetical protein n=1 Tax=Micromonospora sp. NPDC050417 TaxID=3364280 RepID=UPI0037B74E42
MLASTLGLAGAVAVGVLAVLSRPRHEQMYSLVGRIAIVCLLSAVMIVLTMLALRVTAGRAAGTTRLLAALAETQRQLVTEVARLRQAERERAEELRRMVETWAEADRRRQAEIREARAEGYKAGHADGYVSGVGQRLGVGPRPAGGGLRPVPLHVAGGSAERR